MGRFLAFDTSPEAGMGKGVTRMTIKPIAHVFNAVQTTKFT
jgi:hypothetical protein